jgi:hypothetical protein
MFYRSLKFQFASRAHRSQQRPVRNLSTLGWWGGGVTSPSVDVCCCTRECGARFRVYVHIVLGSCLPSADIRTVFSVATATAVVVLCRRWLVLSFRGVDLVFHVKSSDMRSAWLLKHRSWILAFGAQRTWRLYPVMFQNNCSHVFPLNTNNKFESKQSLE